MSISKSLGVVIPTYNCKNILRQTLQSVKWADEIIIVDMGSKDGTVELAKSYGARVYENIPSDGNFDKNRKFGMERVKSDWILKIDSDEVLSQKLQVEIRKFLENDNGQFDGIYLYNRIFMFGKQIRHGFIKPKSNELRMFRKGVWQYFPYKFHQQITIEGETIFFNNTYDHNNCKSINEFILKMNKYTDLDSTKLQKVITVSPSHILIFPIRTFLKLFIVQKGFLDWEVGLVVSFLYSLYNLIEKIKIWEKTNI